MDLEEKEHLDELLSRERKKFDALHEKVWKTIVTLAYVHSEFRTRRKKLKPNV